MERSKRIVDAPRRPWVDMDKMVSDYDTLERNLRDLRTVLAAIAWQQDDKTLTVPVAALQAMPAGVELVVAFDRVLDQYVFSATSSNAPAAAEGTGLTTDDHVPGVLG